MGVEAHSGGPQKWLELERLEHTSEIEKKRKALEEDIRHIRADHARRGLLHSGAALRVVAEARRAYRLDLIESRITLRCRFGTDAPELMSEGEIDRLREDLERTVEAGKQADRDEAQRLNALSHGTLPNVSEIEIQAWANELYALIGREIKKLKLRQGLGIGPKREGNVVLNINNSTVTGLNLGSVVGDMNASLTRLEQQGHAEIVEALKRLSEAIAAQTSSSALSAASF